MKKIFSNLIKSRHFWLCLAALLYLLLSPSFAYQFLTQTGKPAAVWKMPPKEAGQILYNIEGVSYWLDNMVVQQESDTYALGGWAFLEMGPGTEQADYNRFAVIYNDTKAYAFPIQDYSRPDVQNFFNNTSLKDLALSGFNAVISKNALTPGNYNIGILFEHKDGNSRYYIRTDRVLIRTPNRLFLEPFSK